MVLQLPGKIFSKRTSALDVTKQEPGSIQQFHNIHCCGTETNCVTLTQCQS